MLLAIVFHTSWNLMPEAILFSSFGGAELQLAFTLYTVGGIAVSIFATIVAWRWLTGQHASRAVVAAQAPVAV